MAEPVLDQRPQRSPSRFDLPPPFELLRIGTGIVWLVNLLFILYPPNDYWGNFSANALTFAPTTIGGPGFADFVSAHPLIFSWAIALVTGYLAASMLLGLTTRAACVIGCCFSGVLFATQFGSTFFFPGGTDVGEHPLYILIYLTLVLGGAGSSYSVDHVIRDWWAGARLSRSRGGVPAVAAQSTGLGAHALFAYATAGLLVSFGVGVGLVVLLPVGPTAGPVAPTGPTTYMNLTIVINATNGWPQYVPANFSVPAGRVVFTIVDTDTPMNWSGCLCVVHGTAGGTEEINGTPVSVVSKANVAHTFSIPTLGLETFSPGESTVTFVVDLIGPGVYTWYCLAPCGMGADPYDTPPMGTPGYMTGTMTVTSP